MAAPCKNIHVSLVEHVLVEETTTCELTTVQLGCELTCHVVIVEVVDATFNADVMQLTLGMILENQMRDQ